MFRSTSRAFLVPLDPSSTSRAYPQPGNLPNTPHSDLHACVSKRNKELRSCTRNCSPAMEGSKAATIVVLTPCPSVFHFNFSESNRFPSLSMKPKTSSISPVVSQSCSTQRTKSFQVVFRMVPQISPDPTRMYSIRLQPLVTIAMGETTSVEYISGL